LLDIPTNVDNILTGKQVFYTVDEGEVPGKGCNAVLSYVHHYMAKYGLGEKDVIFIFDNCAGQNKNSPVIWYGLWRCIIGMIYFYKKLLGFPRI